MKRTVSIPKSLLSAPIDFGEVISARRACGVRLEYGELGFMQTGGEGIVLFDAYTASHRYAPLNIKTGVIAFPFFLSCMTDGGERVAYCGMRFSEEKATRWKLCCDDAAVAQLAVDRDAVAVPLMSGVCGLAVQSAYEKYYAHIKDEVHPLSGLIVLNGQTHIDVELFGSKYAVFSTGWGDGRFRCYEGVSEAGNTVAFIVDFGMIEYPQKSDSGDTVEVTVDDDSAFWFDPSKSGPENNVARWTAVLETAVDPVDRLNAFSRRGYAKHSLGDTDGALADYIAAVDECKNVKNRGALLRAWSVYDNAAEIYCQRSDYESAIVLMNKALAVRDNFYAGAYTRLIDLYQLTKRTDEAMDVAKKLLEKRPNDPVANMKYAEVCVAEMNYAAAAKTYEKLASTFRLYENLFDEASCLIELGDYDGADAALERHPSKEFNEQYWYYKAYIDYKQKRYFDALKKAEQSHGIDPEYMPALYLLIDIHSLMQEYHAVARYAEEYKKLRPDKEYGYSVCAEAQMILGNYSECLHNYMYIHKMIVKDDKYAALIAIVATKTGEKRLSGKYLKLLRRKKSDYYHAANYAIYITMYRKKSMSLSQIVYKLRTADDFLLQLAVFLTGTNNVLPATRILDMLFKRNDTSFEIVAQQIRTAIRLNDDRLFDRLFEYYIDRFVGEVSDEDKELIAERFKRVGVMRHIDWNAVKGEPIKASGADATTND